MTSNVGYAEAALAGALGLAVAIGAPAALSVSSAGWERVVALVLLLACLALLAAACVVALVAAIRSRAADAAIPFRLLTVADALLIAAVGCVGAGALFLFVLAIIGGFA